LFLLRPMVVEAKKTFVVKSIRLGALVFLDLVASALSIFFKEAHDSLRRQLLVETKNYADKIDDESTGLEGEER